MSKPYRRGKVWYSQIRWPGHQKADKQGVLRVALSTNLREANIRLAELIKERERAQRCGVSISSEWSSFKTEFLKYIKGGNHNTRMHFQRTIRELERHINIQDVRQITPHAIDTMQSRLRSDNLGQYMVAKIIKCSKVIMRKAESWGVLTPQDWRSVKIAKLPRGRVDFFTQKELNRILELLEGPYKTAVFLGARAGLRPAESYHLSRQGVDLFENKIHVMAVECFRCPMKFHPKGLWHPKDREARSIPINAALRLYLEKTLPKVQGPWVIGQTADIESFLAVLSDKLKAAVGHGSAYTLRHTFATHLIQNGVMRERIRDYMGHESITSTEIYAHLEPSEEYTDINRLPET